MISGSGKSRLMSGFVNVPSPLSEVKLLGLFVCAERCWADKMVRMTRIEPIKFFGKQYFISVKVMSSE